MQCNQPVEASLAFTLVELMVVIGVVASLGMLLIPALAGAKADSWGAQCRSNLKYLGNGFGLYTQDHSDMFPPAGYEVGTGTSSMGQLAWDTYIHHYIGGVASDQEIMDSIGILDITLCPKVEHCPADRGPNNSWGGGGDPLYGIFGRRSYAMIMSPENWQVQSARNGIKYNLLATSLGVGVLWQDPTTSTGQPDWDAKSFKSFVVRDPRGTLILAEQACDQSFVGNFWPSACRGPAGSDELHQMDPAGVVTGNQGLQLYKLHGYRFNYLFHDGHVENLTTNATIGTATGVQALYNPKGMWTVQLGD